ncbi:MAG: guanylate kinase [Endomicrobia bacterium]|nr:guanylate kinase [Endomicrobiia bacterium]MCL2507511.1 guanylate kinase [Endomicrobiia bacterium]
MKKTGRQGNIIVVSAPSGAGKTSVCNAIIENDKNTIYSISYTTRKPREGERNGSEYFFADEKKFKKMIKSGEFVEWAKVHGNYYGTPKSFLNKTLKKGLNVLLDIDVQGGLKIKKQYPQACMIFIMPPDLKTLEKRLTSRNKDSKETIKIRLENAKKELKSLPKYEYLVINDTLDKAIAAAQTIIKSLDYKIKK